MGGRGGAVLRQWMRFDERVREFIKDEEEYKKDVEANEPVNVRMARIYLPAMNSINSNLKFTTEAPEDFDKNRLPTLDLVLWTVDGILYHIYYEKTMKTQFTVMPCLITTRFRY